MPTISTMVYPAPGYVRVETNWADVNAAVGAAVYRVDCLTGDRVPLRPYVSFSGDFLDLSCGYGIFWDTEPQLDRCVYYCAQAVGAAGSLVTRPADYLATDTYSRSLANSWGSSNNGIPYSLTGAAADFSVNGNKGLIALPTNNLMHLAMLDVTRPASGILVKINVSALATGANITGRVALAQDVNNYYGARLDFTTTNTVTVALNKLIGGSGSALGGTITVGTYGVGTQFWLRFEFQAGGMPRAKAWLATDPEPTAWSTVAPGTEITTAAYLHQGTLLARAETGNTNVNPIVAFDDLYVYDLCAPAVPIESCSGDLVVPSSGNFRLGDPARPCNDVTLLFDAPVDPDCVPTQGIFFGNMADEAFAANTNSFLPVNARYPIVANRTRRAVASTLTVATRTFADRDALRRLNEPNSPLLLRGPAQYGIPDRYMSVDDVDEMRPVSDHRVQPRAVTMPHFQVARPSGPSQGVCGTRVGDLCDIYPTWEAIGNAGLTWADLLRGKASRDTPIPASVERTWNDVNSQYANWNAVNSGNTDWDDLLDGA